MPGFLGTFAPDSRKIYYASKKVKNHCAFKLQRHQTVLLPSVTPQHLAKILVTKQSYFCIIHISLTSEIP